MEHEVPTILCVPRHIGTQCPQHSLCSWKHWKYEIAGILCDPGNAGGGRAASTAMVSNVFVETLFLEFGGMSHMREHIGPWIILKSFIVV